MLRMKQLTADSIRFPLRVRSRQLGSANSGIQKSQRVFFSSSKPRHLPATVFQVQMTITAFPRPWYPVSLRAQIDTLKKMHPFKRLRVQVTDWEKIFVKGVFNKELLFKI